MTDVTAAELPKPVPGPELAELRKRSGVEQGDLARRLGLHRVTLSEWEQRPELDAIRSARYQRALREAVAEAIGPAEATA